MMSCIKLEASTAPQSLIQRVEVARCLHSGASVWTCLRPDLNCTVGYTSRVDQLEHMIGLKEAGLQVGPAYKQESRPKTSFPG